ncbi:MAG TPA: diguanylate cyclase [Firmicutes bacterium]|nr:diguanylate cyclase [Bacillota bacterium]
MNDTSEKTNGFEDKQLYSGDQLNELLNITRVLLQTVDLKNVLNLIAKSACDMVKADASSIMLYDIEKKAYIIKAFYNLSSAYTKVVKADKEDDVSKRALKQGSPVIIEDIPGLFEERKDSFSLNWIKKEKLFSMACIPIFLGKTPYGAMNIYFRRKHSFTSNELSFISIFSGYSAIAINNANLINERESRIKQLTALNKISFGISGELEMDSLLELIYLECHEIMDTTNFYIALFDQQTKTVSFPIYFQDGTRIPVSTRKLSNGLTDYIIRNKKSLIFSKYDEVQRDKLGIKGVGKKSKSWLGVPMLSRDKVLGVIAVQNFEQESVYDENDENVLKTIANQAAVAIKNAILYEEMKVLSNTDGLTGLYNSRYFWEFLPKELDRALRYKRKLSMAIFDLDNFKTYNDTYGHQVGDFLLKKVSAIIQKLARKVDFCARYGGEEFVVLLPETDKEGALIFAERVRKAIEKTIFKYKYESIVVKMTVSGGVSTFSPDIYEPRDLVKYADSALLKAKTDGKNNIVLFE